MKLNIKKSLKTGPRCTWFVHFDQDMCRGEVAPPCEQSGAVGAPNVRAVGFNSSPFFLVTQIKRNSIAKDKSTKPANHKWLDRERTTQHTLQYPPDPTRQIPHLHPRSKWPSKMSDRPKFLIKQCGTHSQQCAPMVNFVKMAVIPQLWHF